MAKSRDKVTQGGADQAKSTGGDKGDASRGQRAGAVVPTAVDAGIGSFGGFGGTDSNGVGRGQPARRRPRGAARGLHVRTTPQ